MKDSRVLLFLGVALAAPLLSPTSSHAPDTGGNAHHDAFDDARNTIPGPEYPIRAAVVAALPDWPQDYDAGVIGLDRFPDSIHGRCVIPSAEDRGLAEAHLPEGPGGGVKPHLTHPAGESKFPEEV